MAWKEIWYESGLVLCLQPVGSLLRKPYVRQSIVEAHFYREENNETQQKIEILKLKYEINEIVSQSYYINEIRYSQNYDILGLKIERKKYN